MSGTDPLADLVEHAHRLSAMGLSPGTSGNLSVRVGDTVFITPTSCDLGSLRRVDLVPIDLQGPVTPGSGPSKELPLHRALYARDAGCRAVVHLHSRSAVAVSCLQGLEPACCVPALTPYFVMRVGAVPLVPYAEPGSAAQATDLREVEHPFRAALLQNHGPIVAGADIESAVAAAVELEETAALVLTLGAAQTRQLTSEQSRSLAARYGTYWP